MWEGYYGQEPFDFRLTALRLIRNLWKVLLFTLMGTLLFGGGYYVKNVLLHTEKQYSATSTYMLEYVTPPVQSGDYFINEMSWNTLVQSEDFLTGVAACLQDGSVGVEELSEMISAKLPSDWNIPTTTVKAYDQELATRVAVAVEEAMTDTLPSITDALKTVNVIDPAGEAEEIIPDVRPERAVILSAILSFFFVTVIFLLKEAGEDSIWIPSSLRWRYGLNTVGTLESPEWKQNMEYLFANMKRIAVCPLDGRVDSREVVKHISAQLPDKDWTPMPAPLLCPESCEKLREAEGILLVIPAGKHVGKPLEYVFEYFKQQNCKPTAAVLWDADEWLLKMYYCLRSEEV